jgi:hypothetical protein
MSDSGTGRGVPFACRFDAIAKMFRWIPPKAYKWNKHNQSGDYCRPKIKAFPLN